MMVKLMRIALVAAAVTAVWSLSGNEASAQNGFIRNNGLFAQYYVPPGPSGVSAPLYPAPRPTPPFVGHTWITYEPLYPQEFLYRHSRTYYTINPGAGVTRTHVHWGHW